MRIKTDSGQLPNHKSMEWQLIGTAPYDVDLELAVIDAQGAHTLVFPCRRVLHGWIKAGTNEPVDVYPTHWREWDDSVSPLFCRPAS